jgi:hypothetical protein
MCWTLLCTRHKTKTKKTKHHNIICVGHHYALDTRQRQRQTKQKHNTIYIGHHYTQTNTKTLIKHVLYFACSVWLLKYNCICFYAICFITCFIGTFISDVSHYVYVFNFDHLDIRVHVQTCGVLIVHTIH